MKDWNVVISIYQDGFGRALRALREFGPAERSPYYNVLVMKADDPIALLDAVERKTEENTALYDAISRVAPAIRTVDFRSGEEFTEKLKPILLDWCSASADARFMCGCTGGEIYAGCARRTLSACLTTCFSIQ